MEIAEKKGRENIKKTIVMNIARCLPYEDFKGNSFCIEFVCSKFTLVLFNRN